MAPKSHVCLHIFSMLINLSDCHWITFKRSCNISVRQLLNSYEVAPIQQAFVWTDMKMILISFKTQNVFSLAGARARVIVSDIQDGAAHWRMNKTRQAAKCDWQVITPCAKSCSCVNPKREWLFWQVHLFPAVSLWEFSGCLMDHKTRVPQYMFQLWNASSVSVHFSHIRTRACSAMLHLVNWKALTAMLSNTNLQHCIREKLGGHLWYFKPLIWYFHIFVWKLILQWRDKELIFLLLV